MKRLTKVRRLVDRTAAIENGLKVPAASPRYIALEQDLFGNTIWAYFEDTLVEIRISFEDSDTCHVDRIRVHDLDTRQIYLPVWKIGEFVALDYSPATNP
jgi:hypothetical protein